VLHGGSHGGSRNCPHFATIEFTLDFQGVVATDAPDFDPTLAEGIKADNRVDSSGSSGLYS